MTETNSGRVSGLLLSCLLLLLSAAPAYAANKEWRTFTNCTLVANRYNDGDSFHVRMNDEEKIVRLYFVDAPETDARFPDRVAAQAAHFGVTPEEVIAIGKKAARFTTETLAKQPFTITTRGQNAAGSSTLGREYAIVTVGTNDLAELLVANRLVRIHGINVSGIGKERVEKLQAVEAKAAHKPGV